MKINLYDGDLPESLNITIIALIVKLWDLIPKGINYV